MYQSSAQFRRTPEERADQILSWNRDDVRFFAAGACHILAFAFLEAYPEAGFRTVGLWAREQVHPMHAYLTDAEWAFDFHGWTPAAELLAVTRAVEPDADYEQRAIVTDLPTFCREYNHRDRSCYAFDPWERALRYIAQFPSPEQHRATLRS
ncbi:MAG: hypothetical protein M3Z75_01005 [Actinomycetota bacterium]|nr:hypothetical protein [Actinomycetota bacterium]